MKCIADCRDELTTITHLHANSDKDATIRTHTHPTAFLHQMYKHKSYEISGGLTYFSLWFRHLSRNLGTLTYFSLSLSRLS